MSATLLFVLVSWISIIPCSTCAQDGGRELYFPAYYFYAEKHFVNHLIKTMIVKDLGECEYRCYLDANCVSLNIKTKYPNGTHECELNNATHLDDEGDLKYNPLYYYRGADPKCGKNRRECENNATCQSGFTPKGYRCLCTTGFEGEHCEKDINECHRGSHNCHSNATCNNTEGGYNCSCKEGYTGDGQNCTDINECHRGSHNCHSNATCNNTEGGYNCSCKEGYTGDGQNCTDIDECSQGDACNKVADSECKNTDGSYSCQCKDGFVKNGDNCEVDVCRGYLKRLNRADRKDTHEGETNLCDNDLTNNYWCRFEGQAGTRMPTSCVSINRCGANYPGWLDGDHPTVADGEVGRKVCFHKESGCCAEFYYIQVKNCTSYYIYKLGRPPGCPFRYCGTD